MLRVVLHLFKSIYYVFRELVFDPSESRDWQDPQFNTRKFVIALLLSLSFAMNIYLTYKVYNTNRDISTILKFVRELRDSNVAQSIPQSPVEPDSLNQKGKPKK